MHCLTVLYPPPADPAQFRSYYEDTHLSLAKQFPSLKRWHVAYPAPLGPAPAPFCIFRAWFDSEAAMAAALQSEIGRRIAADVPNYSPGGATICHFADAD